LALFCFLLIILVVISSILLCRRRRQRYLNTVSAKENGKEPTSAQEIQDLIEVDGNNINVHHVPRKKRELNVEMESTAISHIAPVELASQSGPAT
jgi:hypothetical protein